MKLPNYYNLIKRKCLSVSSNDLMIINQTLYFKKSKTFETTLIDHYLLVCLMLKAMFLECESKKVFQRDHTLSPKYVFVIDLLRPCLADYEDFESKNIEVSANCKLLQ